MKFRSASVALVHQEMSDLLLALSKHIGTTEHSPYVTLSDALISYEDIRT